MDARLEKKLARDTATAQVAASKEARERLAAVERAVAAVEKKMDMLMKALKEWSGGRNKSSS